jgi:hypothetical protein
MNCQPEQLNLFDSVQTKVCKWCAREFSVDGKTKGNFKRQFYCGRPCFWVSQRASNPWFRQCETCFLIFRPNRANDNGRFCTSECAYEIPFALRVKTIGIKVCDQCNNRYESTAKHDRFCGRRCRINAKTSRRLYLKRTGQNPSSSPAFYLGEIIRRDLGVCAICAELVPAGLRFPNPDSASMDHKTPLSKGGLHLIENVQLSHLRCNIKSKAEIEIAGVSCLRSLVCCSFSSPLGLHQNFGPFFRTALLFYL